MLHQVVDHPQGEGLYRRAGESRPHIVEQGPPTMDVDCHGLHCVDEAQGIGTGSADGIGHGNQVGGVGRKLYHQRNSWGSLPNGGSNGGGGAALQSKGHASRLHVGTGDVQLNHGNLGLGQKPRPLHVGLDGGAGEVCDGDGSQGPHLGQLVRHKMTDARILQADGIDDAASRLLEPDSTVARPFLQRQALGADAPQPVHLQNRLVFGSVAKGPGGGNHWIGKAHAGDGYGQVRSPSPCLLQFQTRIPNGFLLPIHSGNNSCGLPFREQQNLTGKYRTVGTAALVSLRCGDGAAQAGSHSTGHGGLHAQKTGDGRLTTNFLQVSQKRLRSAGVHRLVARATQDSGIQHLGEHSLGTTASIIGSDHQLGGLQFFQSVAASLESGVKIVAFGWQGCRKARHGSHANAASHNANCG